MKRHIALAIMLLSGAVAVSSVARADEPQKPQPAITDDASTALIQMGKTLLGNQFSFKARTIRVYEEENGQPLHIFHTINAEVRRPDRLAVHVNGDDGQTDLFYDGKTVTIAGVDKSKYATINAPDNIEAMMKEVMGRLQVDFPLADFLTNAPNKAFLTGVTTGSEVGTAMVDGVAYRHLFFTQPPGIELELWVAKDQQALPKRLIVTYRLLPGQPNFIAEFSDWNFAIHPSDADFTFQPPAGATKVELKSSNLEGGK